MRVQRCFLYLLLVPLVVSDDSEDGDTVESKIPVFRREDCIAGNSGMLCFIPTACGSGTLMHYLGSPANELCDFQIILRQFDSTKVMIEMWAEGTSIRVRHSEQNVLIGLDVDNGKVVKSGDMKNKKFELLEEAVEENKLYALFICENFAAPENPVQGAANLMFEAASIHNMTRGYLNTLLAAGLNSWCPIPTLRTGLKIPKLQADYHVSDLPQKRVFNKQFTCDPQYELMYEEGNVAKKANEIACILGKKNYQFEVLREDGTKYRVPEKNHFKVGCIRKNCISCAKLPCEGTDCDGIEEKLVKDCPVHYCPRSLLETEEGIVKSNITCAKISEKEFAWSANNKKLASVKCAKEAPCHLISPLKCEDASCSKLTNLTSSPIHCKNEKQMYFEPSGGSKTLIQELTCNTENGQYMKSEVEELPKGAKVICEGAIGAALGDSTTTGGMNYIAIVIPVAILIVVVIVVVICCIRRRAKNSNVATGTTTRQQQETAVSGAASKSSEGSMQMKPSSEQPPSLPDIVPTPLAPPTATPKSPAPLPYRETLLKTPTLHTALPTDPKPSKTPPPRPTKPKEEEVIAEYESNRKGNKETRRVNASEILRSGFDEETDTGEATKPIKKKKKTKNEKKHKKQKKQKKARKSREAEIESEEKPSEVDSVEESDEREKTLNKRTKTVEKKRSINTEQTNPTATHITKGRTEETQLEEKVEPTQRTQITIEQEMEKIQTSEPEMTKTMTNTNENKKGKTPKKPEYGQIGMGDSDEDTTTKHVPPSQQKPLMPPKPDSLHYHYLSDLLGQTQLSKTSDMDAKLMKTQDTTTTAKVLEKK